MAGRTPLTASDVGFTFDYVRTHPTPRFTSQLDDIELVEVVDDRTVVITLRRPALGFFDQPLVGPADPAPAHLGGPAGRAAGAAGAPPSAADRTSWSTGGPVRATSSQANPTTSRASRWSPDRGADHQDGRGEPGGARPAGGGHDSGEPRSLAPGRIGRPGNPVGRGRLLHRNRSPVQPAPPPFDDPGARRAVSLALDPKRIAAAVAGFGTGEAVAAENGYLHPDSPWAPDSGSNDSTRTRPGWPSPRAGCRHSPCSHRTTTPSASGRARRWSTRSTRPARRRGS